MQLKNFFALAASLSVASAHKGFNYGSFNPDGSAAVYGDFMKYFNTAKNLVDAPGFNSARLYTMIQANTPSSIISAIPAAIDTKTDLLLGMWASAGQDAFNLELQTLKAAIKQYGSKFTDRVIGISVGSEDLYRITPIGIKNHSPAGAGPAVVAGYIHQLRAALHGTKLGKAKIGHVDTWTAWANHSNHAVIQAVDFLGVDAYPYYESDKPNNIVKSLQLFEAAMKKTHKAAGKKDVWITETGWPTSGKKSGKAVPNVKNAETYWHRVACKYQDKTPLFWYTLFDQGASGPGFGVVGPTLSTKPRYSLKCPANAGGKKHHKKSEGKKHHKKSEGKKHHKKSGVKKHHKKDGKKHHKKGGPKEADVGFLDNIPTA